MQYYYSILITQYFYCVQDANTGIGVYYKKIQMSLS